MRYSKPRYKYCLEGNVMIQTRLRPEHHAIVQGYIFLGIDGKLVIYKGYAWDGATCGINFDSNLLATLTHDALYQLMREGELELTLRSDADKELRDIMIVEGCWKWIADVFYFFVTTLGNPLTTRAKKVYDSGKLI